MKFEFATATQIVFGPGTINTLGAQAKALGRRALVVTGNNPQRVEKWLTGVMAEGISVTNFPVGGEPEIATVEAGVTQARKVH
jgi:alcohol dehydrogenase class IV